MTKFDDDDVAMYSTTAETDVGGALRLNYDVPMATTLELWFQGATAFGTLLAGWGVFYVRGALDAQRQAVRDQHKTLEAQLRALESQDLSLKAQLTSLDKEYEWRRMNIAIELMREWNDHVIVHRNRIVAIGNELYGPAEGTDYLKKPINEDEASRLWHAREHAADENEKRRLEMHKSIVSLLNYLSISVRLTTRVRWMKRLSRFLLSSLCCVGIKPCDRILPMWTMPATLERGHHIAT